MHTRAPATGQNLQTAQGWRPSDQPNRQTADPGMPLGASMSRRSAAPLFARSLTDEATFGDGPAEMCALYGCGSSACDGVPYGDDWQASDSTLAGSASSCGQSEPMCMLVCGSAPLRSPQNPNHRRHSGSAVTAMPLSHAEDCSVLLALASLKLSRASGPPPSNVEGF